MSIAEFSQLPIHKSPSIPYGVSEVILAEGFGGHSTIFLSILAHLTQSANKRWITWIGPLTFSRQTLESAGINLSKLRIIQCNNAADCLWLFWEALANGKSDTVIAAPNQLTEIELEQLSQAANLGTTQGLIVRHR